ncbi:MAG: HlyD family efflux transporter periplasmic adaptor subunit, partial [Gemmataceae bacterium]
MEAADRELNAQQIRLNRLKALEVYAPRDGVIHRVLANASSGGTFVKQGDVLMVFIPDIPKDSKRVVEVFVDGNDAPQVMELLRQRISRSPDSRIK